MILPLGTLACVLSPALVGEPRRNWHNCIYSAVQAERFILGGTIYSNSMDSHPSRHTDSGAQTHRTRRYNTLEQNMHMLYMWTSHGDRRTKTLYAREEDRQGKHMHKQTIPRATPQTPTAQSDHATQSPQHSDLTQTEAAAPSAPGAQSGVCGVHRDRRIHICKPNKTKRGVLHLTPSTTIQV